MTRAIKYLINLSGLALMWWMTMLSYGLMVLHPCDQISGIVTESMKELIINGLVYLSVVTLLNWFIQRKFEKGLYSREFLYLGAINLVVIILFAWYYTNQFVSLCSS